MSIIKIKISSTSQNKINIKQNSVYFTHHELSIILSEYSKKVSQGTWKDYALDHSSHFAVFSIFKSTYEKPLLMIEKRKSKHKEIIFTLKTKNKSLYSSEKIDKVFNFLNKMPKLVSN